MSIEDSFGHICRGTLLNPHVCRTCGKELPFGPEQTLLAPPPKPEPSTPKEMFFNPGWFVIVFPDTEMHRELAEKLSSAKPAQLLPLTIDELALLSEFMTWPKPPHMG